MRDLCSQPTMSRLESAASRTEVARLAAAREVGAPGRTQRERGPAPFRPWIKHERTARALLPVVVVLMRNQRPARDRDQPVGPVEEHHGSVKFYNPAKGYGFVVPEDGGPDVFVPGIALNRAGLGGLETGQRVSVMVEQGTRGLQARDIEVI